jgi:hypothetical protein
MGIGKYTGYEEVYVVGLTILCWSLIGAASSIFWWTHTTMEIFDKEARAEEEANRRKQQRGVHKEKINMAFRSLSDYIEIHESDLV